MKKILNFINIILIFAVLIGDIIYIVNGGVVIKGITSAGFVLIGLCNFAITLLYKKIHKRFPILMLFGLTFAMAGDIVLEINFLLGAILFAVGHIFYFVAYCNVESLQIKNLFIGLLIFIPSTLFIIFAPIFEFKSIVMKIMCVVYALVISFMVGKSISNFICKKSILNFLILLGSCLFFFSDLMLLLYVFGGLPKFIDILCLVTYYPAECLLAYSIRFSKEKKND